MIQYEKECPCGCGCMVKYNSSAMPSGFSKFAKKALRLFGIGLLKSSVLFAVVVIGLASLVIPLIMSLEYHPLWILIYVVHFAVLYAVFEWSNHK